MEFRKLIITEDGSPSLHNEELKESYHSRRGALAESQHVFIKNGFYKINKNNFRIIEFGFGTGLNCLLTLLEAKNQTPMRTIEYVGVEKFPLKASEYYNLWIELNKQVAVDDINPKDFYEKSFEMPVELLSNFLLKNISIDFLKINPEVIGTFDLLYFDCFGAQAQPELWGEDMAKICADVLNTGGVLTTYSSKASFRRALEKNNFQVGKVPGALGKREMMIATKL